MTGKRAASARGFTLVELLVVVGIIALLVTILMPSLGRALELARLTKCKANLHALGRAWHMYWQDSNDRFPGISYQQGSDPVSQVCLYIMTNNRIVNTGYLWKAKLIGDENIFICPTTDRTTGDPWFDDHHGAYPPWRSPNPWPPRTATGYHHCRMTYGTRRMAYYEKGQVGGSPPDEQREKPFMLKNLMVSDLPSTADFSFMADNFPSAHLARMSHVPGVNVLFVGGNVGFFEDETEDGRILYDDSAVSGNHESSNNWHLDRIWMIIDGNMTIPGG